MKVVEQFKEQQEELQLAIEQLKVLEKYATKITEYSTSVCFNVKPQNIIQVLCELRTITHDNAKNKRTFIELSIFDEYNEVLLSDEITLHSFTIDKIEAIEETHCMNEDTCCFYFLKSLFNFNEEI